MELIRGTTDLLMTPAGENQVRNSAKNLVRLGGLDSMYHSNLRRAKKTADIVTRHMPAVKPMDLGDSLLPWNLGDYQGQPVDSACEAINYFVYHPDEVVPGGESFNQFKMRFLPTFRSLMIQGKTRKVGIASHGRTDALSQAHVMAGMPSDYSLVIPAMFIKEPPGSILYIAPDLSMGRITDQSTYTLQSGVYMIRHGSTAWNGSSQPSNMMTS